MSGDPVFQLKDGHWYHCDETWADYFGPFETQVEAQHALDGYCLWLNNPNHVPLNTPYDGVINGAVVKRKWYPN